MFLPCMITCIFAIYVLAPNAVGYKEDNLEIRFREMEQKFNILLSESSESRIEMEKRFNSLLRNHMTLEKQFENFEKNCETMIKTVYVLQQEKTESENRFQKIKNDCTKACKYNCAVKSDRESPFEVKPVMKSDNMFNGNSTNDKDTGAQEVRNTSGKYVMETSREKRLLLPATSETPSTSVVPTQSRVAFHAQMSKTLTDPGNYQHIEFDHVVTNVGNAYLGPSSTFVCPIAGTYFLSTKIQSLPNKYVETEIVLNGQAVAYLYTYNDNHYNSGSSMVILNLQEHDNVWVRIHGAQHHVGNVIDSTYSTFSGFILWSTA